MNYFFAILILIALFAIVRGIDYIIRLVTKGKKYYHFHLRWFPSFELAIWILFVFWLLRNLHSEEIYYPFLVVAIAILLVLAIGWYVFRDLVSGVILKAGHAMETGMIVKSEAASGVISSLGYLGLELNTPEGETLRVPYSRMIGKGITCQEKSSQLRRQKLSLIVPQKHGVQNIQQKLRKNFLNCPGSLQVKRSKSL
jgi:hypothetical protein